MRRLFILCFRWSLIAGRLPGRTANDIKNYWNSHLSKRLCMKTKAVESEIKSSGTNTTKVIKPLPWTFSSNSKWLSGNRPFIIDTQLQQIPNNTTPRENESTKSWWKSVLAEEDKEEKGKEGTWWLTSWEGGLQQELPRSSAEVEETEKMGKEVDALMVEGGWGEWESMLLDVDLWGLLEERIE